MNVHHAGPALQMANVIAAARSPGLASSPDTSACLRLSGYHQQDIKRKIKIQLRLILLKKPASPDLIYHVACMDILCHLHADVLPLSRCCNGLVLDLH